MQIQLQQALRDLRRTWPQLLITDLLSFATKVVVATPLIGLLLKLFLVTTEDNVLADADIAAFFLHPLGVLALVLLGAVNLGVFLIQVSLVVVIGFGAIEDRRVTYLDALRYVFKKPTRFFLLAGSAIGRLLLLVAPFLAAIGAVYLVLLGEHDINYYLTARPAEFRTALAIAGTLIAVLVIVLLRTISGWTLALPLLLFTDVAATSALRRSREVLGEDRTRVTLVIVAWLAAALTVSAIASFALGRIAGVLVPGFDTSWVLVAVGLALMLLLTFLVQLVIRVVADSIIPLLTNRWFRQLTGPGRLSPSISEAGSLGERAVWKVPGRSLLAGAAVALLVVVGGAYTAMRGIDTELPPAIIAHRGASNAAPENTMAAFVRADEDGADWIELDVQESADGVVIVAHDSDFMKQARNSLKVWDATADDLREIDVGSRFDPAFADQRVPTLRQVLEWAKGRIGVVIELKYYGHDQQLEARVAELVEETGSEDEIMVMSLKLPGLHKFGELRPTWTRGLLNTASLGDLTQLDVDFLALNAAAATRKQIRDAHERGMKVYVWTVDDPVQMSVLLSRGADGIITNEPARAREVLELRERLSPVGQLLVWVAGETGLLRADQRSSDGTDA